MTLHTAERGLRDGVAAPRGSGGRGSKSSDKLTWYLLMGPPFVVIFLVSAVPLLASLWTSTQSWNLADSANRRFVGVDNYTFLLSDGAFWHAVGLTAYQVVGTVAVQILVGLPIAILLARQFAGVKILRSLYLIPMMATPVVVGLMWRMLLNTDSGMVNYLIGQLGVPSVDWLGSARFAMPSIIATDVWMSTPFVVIILLAGIQSIDPHVYEAAAVDGASSWQNFFHITLPLLRPMLLLAVLFRTMDAIRRFDTIYVMTGGGPGNATETLDLHAYFYAFNYLEIGRGSAIATVIFGIILVVSTVLLRGMRAKD